MSDPNTPSSRASNTQYPILTCDIGRRFYEMTPTLGSPEGGTLVTVTGLGFGASLIGDVLEDDDVTLLSGLSLQVRCGFGGYAMNPATVLSDVSMLCETPAHRIAERVPLRVSFNGQSIHETSLVFLYSNSDWVTPSLAPTTGGTVISILGSTPVFLFRVGHVSVGWNRRENSV